MANRNADRDRSAAHRNRSPKARGAGASPKPSYEHLLEPLLRDVESAREKVQGETTSSFALSYLGDSLLSKYDDGDKRNAQNRRRNAVKRFWEAETMCKEANERIRFGSIPESLTPVIRRTQEIIRILLGRYRDENGDRIPRVLQRISEGFGWGPGATTRVRRRDGNPCFKYSGIPEVTPTCSIWADAAIRSVPLWPEAISECQPGPVRELFTIAPGNRVITVPKNSNTDRTISIEPDMNIYVQKGFGRFIRNALRRIGVNLDDQTRNQRLAHLGSLTGRLATIDLSMASDTVSRELVRLLLPPDWFEPLDEVRSQRGVLPSDYWDEAPAWASRLSGDTLMYQKFSSMGNGFTFELEALIFWALSQSVTEACLGKDLHRVSVYGDDIIVPSTAAEPLLEALTWCGFRANPEKSFWQGPFRESCGKHYHNGSDVTPFYVRRPIRTLKDTFLVANNLRRFIWRSESYLPALALSLLVESYERIRGSIPKSWRKPRIPDGFGDGALIGSFDECTPDPDPDGTEAWVVQHLADVPLRRQDDLPYGALIPALLHLELPASDEEISVTPIAGVKTRKVKTYVSWRVNWP